MTRSVLPAILLATLPALGLAGAPPASAGGDVVVYTITSDGTLSTVSYRDQANNTQQLTNVAAPWSMTFTSQAPVPNYSVSARSTGTQLSCTITVNGQSVVRDSDNDGGADVVCHQDWDDD